MTTLPYIVRPAALYQTPVPDPHFPRAGDWLRAWDGVEPLAGLDGVVVGVPLSRASLSHSGAHLLPNALRRVLMEHGTYSSDDAIDIGTLALRDVGDIAIDLLDVHASHAQIAAALAALYAATPLVLMIGGDHSITSPALMARAQVAGATLGLVQFDTHHDVRSLGYGHNNGTPVRSAIVAGAIRGEHVAQVGIHGFSNSAEYAAWSQEQGIGIHTMRAVRQRGILPVLADAMAQAALAPGGVYVTVDMDVLDRAVAPGCPASAPGGMAVPDLLDALVWLGQRPEVVGIDFVEVDPTRDIADITVKTTAFALLSFLVGRALARHAGT